MARRRVPSVPVSPVIRTVESLAGTLETRESIASARVSADDLLEHRCLIDLSGGDVSWCSLSSAFLRSSISVHAIYHARAALIARSGL